MDGKAGHIYNNPTVYKDLTLWARSGIILTYRHTIGARMKNRSEMIQELENAYIERYKDEDPESYDIPGAVVYLQQLSNEMLTMEYNDVILHIH